MIALATQVFQGLFLLFVACCTVTGTTALIWCAVELVIKVSGYVVELKAWLRGQGYELGKSSLHRYGSQTERRLAELKRSTDEARALAKSFGTDRDA